MTSLLSSMDSRRIIAFIGATLWLILGWDAKVYWNGADGFSLIIYPILIFYLLGGFYCIWFGTKGKESG